MLKKTDLTVISAMHDSLKKSRRKRDYYLNANKNHGGLHVGFHLLSLRGYELLLLSLNRLRRRCGVALALLAEGEDGLEVGGPS